MCVWNALNSVGLGDSGTSQCDTKALLSCAFADSEGWFYGCSHNTGMSGLYPGNYVEKIKDSDCWTLHRSVVACTSSGPSGGVCESMFTDDGSVHPL